MGIHDCVYSKFITTFPFLLFLLVVPIIPVVIPLAVDLSDVVSDDLVVRRPTGENNGQGL